MAKTMTYSLQFYDEWDLTPQNIPTRSILVPLEPIGIGTAYTESLTSYIMRIADIHCLSTEIVYKRILEPLIIKNKLLNVSNSSSKQFEPNKHKPLSVYESERWNSINSSAVTMVKALEILTGIEDLSPLTLIGWSEVLSYHALMRKKRAWCPKCFEYWKNQGSIIYEPLLWKIRVVEICPYHLIRLEEICPFCKKMPTQLSANSRVGYCSRCYTWLGNKCQEAQLIENSNKLNVDYDLWVAKSLGNIIAASPNMLLRPTKNGLIGMIVELVNKLAGGNVSAFARFINVADIIVFHRQQNQYTTNINILLKMCYKTNIPLINFFYGLSSMSEVDWSKATKVESTSKWTAIIALRKRRKNEEGMMLTAFTLALNESPPPSLLQVAQRLGYKTTTPLYKWNSGLCSEISERHKTVLKDRSLTTAKHVGFKELKKLLQTELEQEIPRPIGKIMMELGFTDYRTVFHKYPQLCKLIVDKRKMNIQNSRQERLAKHSNALKKALASVEPSNLDAIALELGYNNPQTLKHDFPKEFEMLKQHFKEIKQTQRANIKSQLELALKEDPPLPLKKIVLRLGYRSESYFYARFPELSRSIGQRYVEYLHKVSLSKISELEEQIRQVVIKLHEFGIYPSLKKVQQNLVNPSLKCFMEQRRVLSKVCKELNIEIY